jgi:acylpyruvate hydrolase
MLLRTENEVHHEVELGVLIGKKAKNANASDWLSYIEGYFVGIDFTDRDIQGIAKKNGTPWAIAKG